MLGSSTSLQQAALLWRCSPRFLLFSAQPLEYAATRLLDHGSLVGIGALRLWRCDPAASGELVETDGEIGVGLKLGPSILLFCVVAALLAGQAIALLQ